MVAINNDFGDVGIRIYADDISLEQVVAIMQKIAPIIDDTFLIGIENCKKL